MNKGCSIGLLAGLLGLALAFGFLFLITKLVIWVSMGLFNYDLSDKFWYVYVVIMLISGVLNISVKVKGNK